MLAPVDLHRIAQGQRRTNGVGALAALRPARTGLQGHAAGAVQEGIIALGMQDHPLRVGQHHHALRAAQLLRQGFHDGARMGAQGLVACHGPGQGLAVQQVQVGLLMGLQPERLRAGVGLGDDACRGQRQRGTRGRMRAGRCGAVHGVSYASYALHGTRPGGALGPHDSINGR